MSSDRLFSVILFGSQARGEANSGSDVDVMAVYLLGIYMIKKV